MVGMARILAEGHVLDWKYWFYVSSSHIAQCSAQSNASGVQAGGWVAKIVMCLVFVASLWGSSVPKKYIG